MSTSSSSLTLGRRSGPVTGPGPTAVAPVAAARVAATRAGATGVAAASVASASVASASATAPPPRSRVAPLRGLALPAWWPRLRDVLLAWPVPLLVLLLWSLAARYEWIPTQVLPSPEAVALVLRDSLLSGEL